MNKDNNDRPPRAERLRELRGERTLREVAKQLGLSPATISLNENGYPISAEVANLYSQFYGVEVSEFWTPPELPMADAAQSASSCADNSLPLADENFNLEDVHA